MVIDTSIILFEQEDWIRYILTNEKYGEWKIVISKPDTIVTPPSGYVYCAFYNLHIENAEYLSADPQNHGFAANPNTEIIPQTPIWWANIIVPEGTDEFNFNFYVDPNNGGINGYIKIFDPEGNEVWSAPQGTDVHGQVSVHGDFNPTIQTNGKYGLWKFEAYETIKWGGVYPCIVHNVYADGDPSNKLRLTWSDRITPISVTPVDDGVIVTTDRIKYHLANGGFARELWVDHDGDGTYDEDIGFEDTSLEYKGSAFGSWSVLDKPFANGGVAKGSVYGGTYSWEIIESTEENIVIEFTNDFGYVVGKTIWEIYPNGNAKVTPYTTCQMEETYSLAFNWYLSPEINDVIGICLSPEVEKTDTVDFAGEVREILTAGPTSNAHFSSISFSHPYQFYKDVNDHYTCLIVEPKAEQEEDWEWIECDQANDALWGGRLSHNDPSYPVYYSAGLIDWCWYYDAAPESGGSSEPAESPTTQPINQDKKFSFYVHWMWEDTTEQERYDAAGTIAGELAGEGKSSKIVFGFWPYWVDNTGEYKGYQPDWSSLTHVAYAGIEPDVDGTLDYSRFNDTVYPYILSQAHENDVKVVLLIGLEQATFEKYNSILNVNRDAITSELANCMVNKQADGICIDFEGLDDEKIIPLDKREDFKQYMELFLKELNQKMKESNCNSHLSFCVAPTMETIYKNTRLIDYSDSAILMGYDYHWKGSYNTGPVSPQESIIRSLDELTEYYPEDRVILGLPTYGYEWRCDGPDENAGTLLATSITGEIIGVDDRTMKEAESYHPESGEYFYESLRAEHYLSTPWYRYFSDGYWYQCWYDDDISLGNKIDYVLSKKNLEGIGFWALGFESDTSDILSLSQQKLMQKQQNMDSDIIVEDISWNPSVIVAGETVEIRVTLKNIGDSQYTSFGNHAVFDIQAIDRNNLIYGSAINEWKVFSSDIGNLNPGDEKSVTYEGFIFNIPYLAESLKVTMDIQDGNSENNYLEKDIPQVLHSDDDFYNCMVNSILICVGSPIQTQHLKTAEHVKDAISLTFDGGILFHDLADDLRNRDYVGFFKNVATYSASIISLDEDAGSLIKAYSFFSTFKNIIDTGISCANVFEFYVDMLEGWIRGGNEAGIPCSGGVGACPIYLLIENEYGEQAGYSKDGTIVEEIEGSLVYTFDHYKTVFIPDRMDGATVRIYGYDPATASSSDAGSNNDESSFSLTICEGDRTVFYEDVPVTPYTVGKIEFNSENSECSMDLDYDGDGTVDETREPDSIEDDNGVVNPPNTQVPEFPTIALPVVAILALAFIFQRRRD
ncbi:MAG: PEF-CTERM sorting domain-containing protein [Methanosarcinaceae archaeon]|nr:PEF-CTERM sorting domain-containing protein [Methanosarcinaceae archaeon]